MSFDKIAAHFSAFLRRHIFTRENLWVLLVSLMMILMMVCGTMGTQPRFVYGGF